MFKWKKAAAALAAAAMTVAGAGCTVGSGSAYAMTIDGEQINAGTISTIPMHRTWN